MPYTSQGTVVIPPATGSTQTNITLVITGTDVKLKTVANGGQIQNTVSRVGQTVPADLILSSDQAGLNLYNWGWDFYDAVNGIATIWVLIPSLTSGASITIYVSIGNTGVSTYQGGAQGSEFDGNTLARYHFPDGTTPTSLDFSVNSFNLTRVANPLAVAGKIDGGILLVKASAQYLLSGTNAALVVTDFTTSVWVKLTSYPAGGAAPNDLAVVFCEQQTNLHSVFNIISITPAGKIQLDNSGVAAYLSSATLSLGIWYKITVSLSGTTGASLFINNTLDGISGITTGTLSFYLDQINYGRQLSGGTDNQRYLDGAVDEAIISSVARSANWIATEYANQNSIPSISAFSGLGQKSRLTLLGIG